MKTHSFNLVREKWIPCLDTSGSITYLTLYEVLTGGTQWTEIRCPSPLQTVAVLRLLLAILYRACPVTSEDEWQVFWTEKKFDVSRIDAYFAEWEDAFDLFSATRPFFQIAGLEIQSQTTKKGQTIIESKPRSLLKLATELATDANSLVFERATVQRMHSLSPRAAALHLLEIQAFGLGGGISSDAVVHATKLDRPNFADGSVARSANVFFSGNNLFETLCLNLTTDAINPNDLPIWEQKDPLSRLEQNASGFVDRLTWLSRLILLRPEWDNDKTIVRTMFFTQGRKSDSDYVRVRDQMHVYGNTKKDGITFRRLQENRASWRDLHSWLVFDPKLRNRIISHISNLINEDILPSATRYRLNVIGIVADKADVTLLRHDRMSLPALFITDNNTLERLRQGIDASEFVAEELLRRMHEVTKSFLTASTSPDPKDVEKLTKAIDPRRAFWARMETHFSAFVGALDGDENHIVEALQKWRTATELEAEVTLRQSCANLGHSGRAMKATACVHFRFEADRQAVTQKIEAAKKKKSQKKKGGTE